MFEYFKRTEESKEQRIRFLSWRVDFKNHRKAKLHHSHPLIILFFNL